MVLDASLLNTQHKVLIKGKVEQSREKSSIFLCSAVPSEKEASRSSSTMLANFT